MSLKEQAALLLAIDPGMYVIQRSPSVRMALLRTSILLCVLNLRQVIYNVQHVLKASHVFI
jgi:hypothetical protein